MSKINRSEKFVTFGGKTKKLINSDPCSRAWVEVDSKAIENNSRVLKNFIGKDCLLMAVVKPMDMDMVQRLSQRLLYLEELIALV